MVIVILNHAEIKEVKPVVKPTYDIKAYLIEPQYVKIDGYLGQRIDVSWRNRLLKVDTEPLLAGFRKKAGSHPWIGEHIGKWLHASCLAYAYTGDTELWNKIENAVNELIKTQESDGYLGNYVPEKRFGLYPEADWDVWVHKYNLIGLLSYYKYSGNEKALESCKKISNLLINTFGENKKSILKAGTHVGMAATSVLEPIVWLYKFTGDKQYLEFVLYIVKEWDAPGGPAILKSLLTHGNVSRTANAKAYEMLSNLVGLCQLAEVTGERMYIEAAKNAWEDIVARRLYITGSASQGEHFRGDYELPNQESAHVAETCVTVTWLQLNLELLRLTGDVRYANELEKTIYNHLCAAQRPDGTQWCYFTSLEGKKPYGPGINCCVSSGPRGLALSPLATLFTTVEGKTTEVVVSTFETAKFQVRLNGQTAQLNQKSEFPLNGKAELSIKLDKPQRFAIHYRAPQWAMPMKFKVNGKEEKVIFADGRAKLAERNWKSGDKVEVTFNLSGRLVIGEHTNSGLAAICYGPFVLAFDNSDNPELSAVKEVGFTEKSVGALKIKGEKPLKFETSIRAQDKDVPGVLRAFADAGSDGGFYRVWLKLFKSEEKQ